ncbi:hypothetical protein Back11_14640 [Paenibacillus baekrokdamisoli]|uniref:Uncharacterized protein n=1 Tax=Paenibacillus baekrokdamisoli TaxID=1712516 RepID=A0A3G9JAU1_9BACL|nr:hypothetical protein [Paenibacillus baekrokdamisoli]MBB3072729.1 iron uptake system EfeUOB component EfeO/EfeM [Paenibacillus baekrokdamisoli]BBH20119.1 hypothetical protein Back11_14640 [Paenibacillus baekrokdamisoli]
MKAIKGLTVLLCLVIVLTACSSKSSSTSDGAKKMQDTLTDMQKNVDANDSAKVIKNAEDLETNWQKFEDDVKKDQADLYGKVEDPLGAIQTGVKQDPLDQATLKEQITKLNDVLKEIK